MNETYPFKLKPLPYPYDAMEPYIDKETMMLHHDKHLRKYVDELNKILKDYPEYHEWTIEKILYNLYSFPEKIRTGVRNNAGGVFNHNMYFSLLEPVKSNRDGYRVKDAIMKSFGSMEKFYSEFKEAAIKKFGSGYAVLVIDRTNKLKIVTTSNQDTTLEMNLYPILLIDVWEHAYYLKYHNLRDEYVNNFIKIINWNKVEENYMKFFMR